MPIGAALTKASALRMEGRFAAAGSIYQSVIQSHPNSFDAWAGLAECCFASRSMESALAAWDRALAIAPASALALSRKAAVYVSLGQSEPARALLAAALAHDSASIPARLGLARLELAAGRTEAATALIAAIDQRRATLPEVLWLSAQVALSRGDAVEAARQLQTLLLQPQLEPSQRADALLLHGEALAEMGDSAAAFATAVAGKAYYHQHYAELAASRESEAAKLTRLANWFKTAAPADWRAPPRLAPAFPHEAAGHCFLVGFPRSGTTLLEQVLAGHPEVRALEEAPTLADHYAEFLSSDDGCRRLAQLTAAEADHWRARYWQVCASHGVDAGGKLFVDKAPAGTLYLPLIAKLFPGAKILFALRDPRDVVLSCLRNAFQMNAMTYAFTTLDGTAECYTACMAMAAVYRQLLHHDILDVRHEALVDDLDAEIARITGFLGLTPDAAMRDFVASARGRSVQTPSARQVRAGLNRRGVARWQGYRRELAPVLPSLAPWVSAFGYEP